MEPKIISSIDQLEVIKMILTEEQDQFIGLKRIEFNSEKEVEDIVYNTKELNDIFEEDYFILGRQVEFEGISDKLDVLAIDKQGNLVIIEVKLSFFTGSHSHLQASRYAGYVSLWSPLHIKNLAEDYFLKAFGNKINFEKKMADFLEVDLSYINQDQKVVLIGSDTNEKLISTCYWLSNQGVNLKLFQATKYKSTINEKEYVDIRKINLKSELKVHAPKLKSDYNKEYHLSNCSWEIKKLAEVFVQIINDFHDFEGPFWDNKSYVYFTKDNKNILEFWINKKSINVKSRKDYQRRNSVDKYKVINALKERLNFSIDNKFNFKF